MNANFIIGKSTHPGMTQMATLQIATFGSEGQEGIAAGIRNFPVHKLVLLCYSSDKQKADDFSRKLRTVLGMQVMISVVARENVIRDTMERVGEILNIHKSEFQQVLMNVSCGDKLIGCAALSAAFINGIKAFGMDSSGAPLLMPVLKLSYSEIISEAKIKILKAIQGVGGTIESLEQLEQASGYGKPVVVAGFEPLDILQSIYMLMMQLSGDRAEVENQYTRVVPWDGNLAALTAINEVMELRPYFEWRGLGFITHSAMRLREGFRAFDAEVLFDVPGVRVADPEACQCGEVLKGVLKPWECKVFGTACTPETPIGTCMVSPEGACAAYYNFGRFTRQRVKEATRT